MTKFYQNKVMQNKSQFLGIVVSKETLDYALIDTLDKVILQGKISNDNKGFNSLEKTLTQAGYQDFSTILFGMENTGLYSNPLKAHSVVKS